MSNSPLKFSSSTVLSTSKLRTKCVNCGCDLNEKCFSREGKLYCRDDFYRKFGPKCSGCGEGLSPQDMVRKAKDRVFHLKCFTCHICRKQLLTGEELYVVDEDKFVCKRDYLDTCKNIHSDSYEDDDLEDSDEGYVEPPPSIKLEPSTTSISSSSPGFTLDPSDSGMYSKLDPSEASLYNNNKSPMPSTEGSERDLMNDSEGSLNGDGDDDKYKDDGSGGSKRRGPRTTIKAKQLEVLKTAFNNTPKPTRHIREQLAKDTGLPMRVIQVWFQNKRSKERRMKQMCNRSAGFFFGGKRLRGFGPPGSGMDDGFFYDGPMGLPPSGFFPGGPPMGFGGPIEQPVPMSLPPMVGEFPQGMIPPHSGASSVYPGPLLPFLPGGGPGGDMDMPGGGPPRPPTPESPSTSTSRSEACPPVPGPNLEESAVW